MVRCPGCNRELLALQRVPAAHRTEFERQFPWQVVHGGEPSLGECRLSDQEVMALGPDPREQPGDPTSMAA